MKTVLYLLIVVDVLLLVVACLLNVSPPAQYPRWALVGLEIILFVSSDVVAVFGYERWKHLRTARGQA